MSGPSTTCCNRSRPSKSRRLTILFFPVLRACGLNRMTGSSGTAGGRRAKRRFSNVPRTIVCVSVNSEEVHQYRVTACMTVTRDQLRIASPESRHTVGVKPATPMMAKLAPLMIKSIVFSTWLRSFFSLKKYLPNSTLANEVIPSMIGNIPIGSWIASDASLRNVSARRGVGGRAACRSVKE
jgi:hypothetical protein